MSISALEVFYENALYQFTFDIDIDIILTVSSGSASLLRTSLLRTGHTFRNSTRGNVPAQRPNLVHNTLGPGWFFCG